MPPQSQSQKIPTSSKLVNEALIAMHSAKGVTLKRLYSYITETYRMVITEQRKVLIKKHISSLREAEDIINITGSGLRGHFKLVNKRIFVRRLNATETNATRRKNDPSLAITSTVQAKAPVELPVRIAKRNRMNMEPQQPTVSDSRTKRITAKRRQHDNKMQETTLSEVPPLPNAERQVQAPSLLPKSVKQRAPPPGTSTVQAKAPVELPSKIAEGSKRNRMNIETEQPTVSDSRTKHITAKRKQHEDRIQETTLSEAPPLPPPDRIRRTIEKSNQINAEQQVQAPSLLPKSVKERVPPPGRASSKTVKTKQTNAKISVGGVKPQSTNKSAVPILYTPAAKRRQPLRTKPINAEPQILSPENLIFPQSQEYPLNSQSNTENTCPAGVTRLSPARTLQSSAEIVQLEIQLPEAQVILSDLQANTKCLSPAARTERNQDLYSAGDRQHAPTANTLVLPPLQNTETQRSFSDEDMEYATHLDDTPMVSSSVHASTPIPKCSVLLAPRRNRTNVTFRDFTSSLSIAEETPRTSLTKKRRRIDV